MAVQGYLQIKNFMPDQMVVSELIGRGQKVLILTKNFDKTSIKVWKTADLYQWIQQVKSVLNPPILPQMAVWGSLQIKNFMPDQIVVSELIRSGQKVLILMTKNFDKSEKNSGLLLMNLVS